MLRLTSENGVYTNYQRQIGEVHIVGRVVWFARTLLAGGRQYHGQIRKTAPGTGPSRQDGQYRPKKQQRAGRSHRSAARRDGRLPRNATPVEVTISHVGGRGDGVGTASYTHNHQSRQHMVFVPASLPGERVLAQPLSLNAQGIRARMIELIEPVAARARLPVRPFRPAAAASSSIGRKRKLASGNRRR